MIYTGALSALLTVDLYPQPPNSLDEVAMMVERENLDVGICCMPVQEALGNSKDTSMKTLWEKVRFYSILCVNLS